MDERAKFIGMAQESHDFLEFTREFVRLAITSSLDNETLRTLLQIGATLNQAQTPLEHHVSIRNTPRHRTTTDNG